MPQRQFSSKLYEAQTDGNSAGGLDRVGPSALREGAKEAKGAPRIEKCARVSGTATSSAHHEVAIPTRASSAACSSGARSTWPISDGPKPVLAATVSYQCDAQMPSVSRIPASQLSIAGSQSIPSAAHSRPRPKIAMTMSGVPATTSSPDPSVVVRSSASHADNPTFLYDIFCRTGGAGCWKSRNSGTLLLDI